MRRRSMEGFRLAGGVCAEQAIHQAFNADL